MSIVYQETIVRLLGVLLNDGQMFTKTKTGKMKGNALYTRNIPVALQPQTMEGPWMKE